MAAATSENQSDSLSVPWNDAVRFIRQLSHDLRNHLNAIELQSTYIGELTDNAAVKDEIKRLREMISGFTTTLQKLPRGLADVKASLIPYRAADLSRICARESTAISQKREIKSAGIFSRATRCCIS